MAADKKNRPKNKDTEPTKKNLTNTKVTDSENSVRRRMNATRMEEIRWDPDRVFRENPYYLRLATKYKIVKYITIVLALVFAVTMLTAFSGDITAENFQYLRLKYLMLGLPKLLAEHSFFLDHILLHTKFLFHIDCMFF